MTPEQTRAELTRLVSTAATSCAARHGLTGCWLATPEAECGRIDDAERKITIRFRQFGLDMRPNVGAWNPAILESVTVERPEKSYLSLRSHP